MLTRRRVVDELRKAKGNGLTLAELLSRLAGEEERQGLRVAVKTLLGEAEERGEVVSSGARRFIAVEHTDHWVGSLRVTSRGFGVLRTELAGDDEIIVPAEKLGTALDGDQVLVHRGQRRKRGRLEPERYGEVVKVLRRRRPTIVGRFHPGPEHPWVEPFARRLSREVFLEPIAGEAPRAGEFVEVSVEEIPEEGPVVGRLLRRLGSAGEAGVDEEVVLAELAIPVEFPPPALAEAETLPSSIGDEDREGRTDFRDHPAVTIDGETAKDFDDAVVAFAAPEGAVEVFVHIADVSHYVSEDGALDLAARERGTSVYLPGRCVPMLPEKLSNHLCSLVPDEDRLAFSVRFLVTPDGAIEGYRAERTVFRSRRRCTYGEVFGWLEAGEWPEGLPDGVRKSLLLLDQAAQRLNRRRRERGAIDFDLPEPEILIDPDGFMTGVQAAERNRAHRLIEELMVAANECVARMLVWGRQPGLFRVHERPSEGKLAELQVVLEEFGVPLKGDLEDLPPKELQRVLDAIQGKPEERFLQTLVLRSLARAAYHPECKGHYALATDFYLHFTSPIRRYPDLVVHRFLGRLLTGERLEGSEREIAAALLEDLAQSCSFTERRAEEAERDVVQWKQVEFMRDHVGEEFSGHISGVVAFGLFVQLDQVYVEGLVHVADLKGDYYRYDEARHRLIGRHSGRTLRLGDTLRVRVKGIDEEHIEVDLEPILEPVSRESREGPRRSRRNDRPRSRTKRSRVPRRPQGRRSRRR